MITWLWRKVFGVADDSIPAVEKVLVEGNRGSLPEDVYHDAARQFLNVQISSFDVLDAKAAQIISVGSVVLPVTFALLNFGSRQVDIPALAIWTLGMALCFYLALLFCVIRANLIRGLEYRPNLKILRQYSEEYPGDILQRWVANEYMESSEKNANILIRKARWLGAAGIAPFAEGLLLSSAAILTLLL